MLALDDVIRVLQDFEPRRRSQGEPGRCAAVAAVLRDGPDAAELLFIHRAEDPRDPWSGHMAFPGGRVDPSDRDSLAAAMRETTEEVGLDLEGCARLVGRLSDVSAVARGRRLGLVIQPFVFAIDCVPDLHLNYEVQEAVWVPLSFLANTANRSTLQWKYGDVEVPLPCYRYESHVIWGLTFGMVDELLGLLDSGR